MGWAANQQESEKAFQATKAKVRSQYAADHSGKFLKLASAVASVPHQVPLARLACHFPMGQLAQHWGSSGMGAERHHRMVGWHVRARGMRKTKPGILRLTQLGRSCPTQRRAQK